MQAGRQNTEREQAMLVIRLDCMSLLPQQLLM
jgi:hypothetical protein